MSISKLVDNLILNKYTKEELNKFSGVYILSFGDKHYIGSCKLLKNKFSRNGFYYRLYSHIYLLNKNKHHSKKLQNAYNKYGVTQLNFDILFICDNELTLYIEQYWLNILNTYKVGYNSSPNAISNFGYKHSYETKLKMSKSKKGKPSWNKGLKLPSLSISTKDKLSKALIGKNKGKKLSQETKDKISKTLQGKKITQHQYNKMMIKVKQNSKENHWNATKIHQFSLNGDFIKSWNYIWETEDFGYKPKQISACLNKRQKTSSGYKWTYEHKNLNLS